MRTVIEANTKEPYKVIVGSSLLQTAGSEIKTACPKCRKLLVVSDSNVAPIYMQTLIASIRSEGIEACEYVYEAGEKSKNVDTFSSILRTAAKEELTRTDVFVSLGGGVCSDMTGFAAASYLRGVKVVHVSTSLLGQVDAAIGGKTGFDLPEGKNMVGAFWQPSLVIEDVDTLASLSDEQFTEGMAEVIKTALICDKELFELLDKQKATKNSTETLCEIVARCAQDKIDVVVEDEHDNGIRQILNFGHTIAHVLEKNSQYELSHGKAVAQGMGIMLTACARNGVCSTMEAKAAIELITRYGLEVDNDTPRAELAAGATSDKKKRGSDISVILIEEIGKAKIQTMNIGELEAFLG